MGVIAARPTGSRHVRGRRSRPPRPNLSSTCITPNPGSARIAPAVPRSQPAPAESSRACRPTSTRRPAAGSLRSAEMTRESGQTAVAECLDRGASVLVLSPGRRPLKPKRSRPHRTALAAQRPLAWKSSRRSRSPSPTRQSLARPETATRTSRARCCSRSRPGQGIP